MSTVRAVTFDVIGIPAPQGSKRAYVVRGHGVIVDDNKEHVSAWRDSVAEKARETFLKFGQFDGALCLRVVFVFPLPKSRGLGVRRIGMAWKSTKPDASKLLRAVEDALTAGGLIADDARIAMLQVSKLEVDNAWSGATISVEKLDPINADEILDAQGIRGR